MDYGQLPATGPFVITPSTAYLICSTQRSGSTYLCELLASTGVAGNPQEYFEARAETGLPPHPGYFLAGLPRTGAGIRDDLRPTDGPDYSDLRTVDGWAAHLERTFRLGTTGNGVFGAKLMWNQVPDIEVHAAALPEFVGLTGSELLEALFGHPSYVWMRRRDKVRQAISLWRALQTRTWRLEHPRSDAGPPVLRYSYDGIEHLRRRLSADDDARTRTTRASLPSCANACTGGWSTPTIRSCAGRSTRRRAPPSTPSRSGRPTTRRSRSRRAPARPCDGVRKVFWDGAHNRCHRSSVG